MGGEQAALEVVERVRISAPRHVVWSAIVERAERRSWWPGLDVEPRIGGRFVERWCDDGGVERFTRGHVTNVDPGRLVRLHWADDGWSDHTVVEVELAEVSTEPGPEHGAGRDVDVRNGPANGGIGPASAELTEVCVRHVGWHRLPGGEALVEPHRSGWRAHLAALRAHAERIACDERSAGVAPPAGAAPERDRA